VIIDGIRQRATLEHLRQLASPKRVAVLYVHTPFNVAFEFFQSREGPQTTLEQFMMFRTAPVEREVEQLLSFADVVLFNWSGRDQFARTVRQLMRELNTEPVKTP
jgi:dephospho-CoA kinase